METSDAVIIRCKSSGTFIWMMASNLFMLFAVVFFIYLAAVQGHDVFIYLFIAAIFILLHVFTMFVLLRVNLAFEERGFRFRRSIFGKNQFINTPWDDVKSVVYENMKGGWRFPMKLIAVDDQTFELEVYLDLKNGRRAMEVISRHMPEEKLVDVSTRYVRFEEERDDGQQ